MSEYCGACADAFTVQEKIQWDKMEPVLERPEKCGIEHAPLVDCDVCRAEFDWAYYTDFSKIFAGFTLEEYKAKLVKERSESPPGVAQRFLCEVCGGCMVDKNKYPVSGVSANSRAAIERRKWFGWDDEFKAVPRE